MTDLELDVIESQMIHATNPNPMHESFEMPTPAEILYLIRRLRAAEAVCKAEQVHQMDVIRKLVDWSDAKQDSP